MYSSKIRNIELPENLFSNLGEMKSKKLNTTEKLDSSEKKVTPSIEVNDREETVKMTNFSKHKEYRERINQMYEGIKEISPIDNEIDNVIYFNNYAEKGIVVKPKVASLKQFWTEYRLINNEKLSPKLKNESFEEQKLSDFDELFDALQTRVGEINKYIDELKEMRVSIHKSSAELEKDKERLSHEKQKFIHYKTSEESRIKKEQENLKVNYDRLQTIIDDLDKKLESIDQ